MSKERIHKLLEAGLKKGFNLSYIKKTLAKQGYDKEDIEECIYERDNPPEPEKESNDELIEETEPVHHESHAIKEKNRLIPYLYLVILILIVSLGMSLFIRPDVVQQEIVIEKNCPEQPMSQCDLDDTSLREKLENYNKLSGQINEKQAAIDEQIALIESMNATIDLKEDRLNQQLEELKTLNSYLKQERREVVNLLIEVVNYILKQ